MAWGDLTWPMADQQIDVGRACFTLVQLIEEPAWCVSTGVSEA